MYLRVLEAVGVMPLWKEHDMKIQITRCSEEAHNTESWAWLFAELFSAGFGGSKTEGSAIFPLGAAVNYSSPT